MSLDPDTIRDGGEQDYPEYLLQKNQVATEDNLELFQAALRGSVTDCDRLLRRGAKPNFFYRPEDHKNAIHVAAEKGFYEVCKVLIHGGAEVNSIAAFDHSSPLTLAAFNDDADLIKLLLDHGAHINHGNGYGNTALHEACRFGNSAVIQYLLKAGADVNSENHKGSTPLHIYCYGDPNSGSNRHPVAVCRQLIEHGAKVNTEDHRGATPLLVACSSGRIDFIELLADSGANMRAKDHSGKNAQDIAEFYGHEAACKFLASHGAK